MLVFAQRTLWSVLLVLLFIACQADNAIFEPIEPEPLYENVDEALWPFFKRFEAEGKARGLAIDIDARGITGIIEELHEDRVAGQCSYSYSSPRKITIDQEFWERSNNAYREMIIFHELGHCYLNRGHKEEAFANGRCVSIMRSGNGACFDFYNSTTREDYIDELFEFAGE